MKRTRLAFFVVGCMTLILGGCAKSCSRKKGEAPPQEPTAEAQPGTQTPNYTGITVTHVVKRDVLPGTGNKEIKNGSTVKVSYTEWVYDPAALGNKGPLIYETKGGPRSFKVGSNEVIKGFEVGLSGATKGSKGMLIIPAAEAYGDAGRPPAIPPKAMVMITFEVVDVD